MLDHEDGTLLCRVFFGKHDDEDGREMFEKSQRPIAGGAALPVPDVPVGDYGGDGGGGDDFF